jgi:DNA-binding PadR family transcriptional regulator
MNSTHTTRQVLGALLAADGEIIGYDVVKATGLQPGTVYPILRRLADNGYATTRESLNEARQRVLYYRLTDAGQVVAGASAFAAGVSKNLPNLIRKETPKP